MKHSLLINKVELLERTIFDCKKCSDLVKYRETKEHNCPVLGFNYNHYINATVVSVCEAPGVYKPHKGEVFIDKYEDFHKHYDTRLQDVSQIGERLFSIFSKAGLKWIDIQHFNVVCCSPPNYRTPEQDEVENCLDYLNERIKLIEKLKVIIAFGNIAKQALLRLKINKLIIRSYHPSYIWRMEISAREEYIENITKQIKDVL